MNRVGGKEEELRWHQRHSRKLIAQSSGCRGEKSGGLWPAGTERYADHSHGSGQYTLGLSPVTWAG